MPSCFLDSKMMSSDKLSTHKVDVRGELSSNASHRVHMGTDVHSTSCYAAELDFDLTRLPEGYELPEPIVVRPPR